MCACVCVCARARKLAIDVGGGGVWEVGVRGGGRGGCLRVFTSASVCLVLKLLPPLFF